MLRVPQPFCILSEKGRIFLPDAWEKFMDEHGLDDLSDPMDELPTEVMLYRWENE